MSVKRQSLLTFLMVFLGLAFAMGAYDVARSQITAAATRGPYQIAQGDRLMVWRIDQSTGRVSYCLRDTVSTDPRFIANNKPFCSAWSE